MGFVRHLSSRFKNAIFELAIKLGFALRYRARPLTITDMEVFYCCSSAGWQK